MSEMPAWSFSALKQFENCPYQYYREKVVKDIPIDKSYDSPIAKGERAHTAIELRLKDGIMLPVEYKPWEPMIEPVARLADKASVFIENEMAIDKELNPVGWFARGANMKSIVWGRCKIDVLTINGERAWVNDWKTGKIREDEFQMQICAIFVFNAYPEVQEVTATFAWLEHGKMGIPYRYKRQDSPRLWQMLNAKIGKVEAAFAKDQFPKREGFLCAYCAVKDCEFNRSK